MNHDLSIKDVLKELDTLRTQDDTINNELLSLVKQREVIDKEIKSISTPSIEISSLRTQLLDGLTTRIQETSVFAASLSTKVRALDMAQSRLQIALERVEGVLDLKRGVEYVRDAIDNEAYEDAAKTICRVLHEQTPVEGDASYQLLVNMELELRRIIHDKINENTNESLQYATLLPLLDCTFDGLSIYCKRQTNELRKTLEHDGMLLSVQPDNAVIPFVDMMTNILECTKRCIQRNRENIIKYFGDGSLLRLVQHLYHFVDDEVERIIQEFIAKKKIMKIVEKVQHVRMSQHDSNTKKPMQNMLPIDANDLDTLLIEISYISQECEIFDIMMRQIAKSAVKQLNQNEKQCKLLNDMKHDQVYGVELPHVSRLNKIVQEIVGYYISLEESCMLNNVCLAISIDECRYDSLTSSMVDEVFYVLKTCTERAFSTCSVSAACAIVNHINTVLSRDYKNELERTLKEYEGNHSTNLAKMFSSPIKLTSGNVDANDKHGGNNNGGNIGVGTASMENNRSMSPIMKQDEHAKLYIALNNLSVSGDNILTLKQHLESEFETTFAQESDYHRMVQHCLADMESIHAEYKTLLRRKIDNFASKLGISMKSLMERYNKISYDLTEVDYNEAEMNDPFVDSFSSDLMQQLTPIRHLLTEENYDLLLQSLLRFVVKRLEVSVFKKKFTFWGGLRFDKDIRKLLVFFSTICRKSVRDRFSRLTQIASILQLEKAHEILDYWDDATQVWRLYARDVRAVLQLRVDFSKTDIQRLRIKDKQQDVPRSSPIPQ